MRNCKVQESVPPSVYRGRGAVDEELRVHGVNYLRVADASVFPALPSNPIASIVMAIGIGAGEMINEKFARKEVSMDKQSLSD